MKRLLSVLACALFLLAACAPATPTVPPLQPTPTPTPFPAGTPVPARIRMRGVLWVGVRYDLPPFGFVTDEGTLAGFDVDLGRELARRWLGDPQAVQFRQVRSDTAAQHIQTGDVDLALGALIHTRQAEAQVDFGPPYFWDGHALLVRAAEGATITAPGDLAGLPVGVVEGEDAAAALAAVVPFTPTLQAYGDFDRALAALESGEVVAVTDLRRRLVRGLSMVPGSRIVGQYTRAAVAPAFAQDEPGLSDLVALTFQAMLADGTYETLYARWFPGDPLPTFESWPGATTISLAQAEETQRVSGTLAALETRGRLRVAMVSNRPPFASYNVNGEPTGYEVQLVRLLAERWLGDRAAVDFLPVTAEEGRRMLTAGEADLLIGGMAHTQEAERQADFSLTTCVAGEGVMVQEGVDLEDVAGLNGQTVAVVSGTGSADALQRAAREAGISVAMVTKASLEEAIAALQAGEVFAVVGERANMLGPAYATEGVFVTAVRLTRVPLALMLPPGDSAFRDRVNLTLQELAQEGTFATLYTAWFDDAPPELEPWPGE